MSDERYVPPDHVLLERVRVVSIAEIAKEVGVTPRAVRKRINKIKNKGL